MMQDLKLRVDPSMDGVRLDRYLRAALPGLPARSVDWAIGAGDVSVGGARAAKGRIVRRGEDVLIRRIPEAADWLPRPGNLQGASVLFEDGSVTVLEKPAGAHTEAHRPGEAGTLAGYLLERHPAVAGFSGPPGFSLLARLDFEVSGAVPAALSAEAWRFLVRERDEGRIRKVYACLVAGRLEDAVTISFLLETRGGETVRARTDRREPDPSYWTALSPVRAAGPFTLVRAAIAKGRRHQVRAHLAAAGFPIVGDARYGAGLPDRIRGGRLMLHAAEVSFVHPVTKKPLTVVSPLPGEFDVSG